MGWGGVSGSWKILLIIKRAWFLLCSEKRNHWKLVGCFFHFPNDLGCWGFFNVLIWHLNIFGECLFISCSFSYLIVLLLFSAGSFFNIYSGYKSFLKYMLYKYFCKSLVCLFILLKHLLKRRHFKLWCTIYPFSFFYRFYYWCHV